MIVTSFEPKHRRCSVIVESPDDLWTLRRLIRAGDVIVTKSSRVVKKEEEYARPDKGERIKVTVALKVDEVRLDSSIERLRVRGTIEEAGDESVSRSGSHSVSLTPGHALTIMKEDWTPQDIRLVEHSGTVSKRFLIVVVDRREAGIGLLSGSHLSVLTTIESGLGGKMGEEQSSQPFMKKVLEAIKTSSREGDTIVVAGPGHTRLSLANLLSQDSSLSGRIRPVEGYDLAGSDGIRELLKFPGFQKVAADAKAVAMQNVVDECVRRISMGDGKVAYTASRVREAAAAGAVETAVISDNIFGHGVNEDEVVDTMNLIEGKGGTVYLADTSLEPGKQVSAFGGIIAILRYNLKS